jgi:multidrug efflux pump
VRVRTQVGGGLVRTRGQPFQMVLGGPDYAEMAQWRDIMLAKMAENPGFIGPDSDYKETRPQMRVIIDKTRAADLGVSAQAIGTALETMMGGRRVTTFVDNGEEYDVMLQADRVIAHVGGRPRCPAGACEGRQPHSAVQPGEPARSRRARHLQPLQPPALDHPQRAPGAGLPVGRSGGVGAAGGRQELPPTRRSAGRASRASYQKSGGEVLIHLRLALADRLPGVLAAQFESFVHPLVIMLTVPLARAGCVDGPVVDRRHAEPVQQIGIVMLIGLAAKNGILIVEFANQLRDAGQDVSARPSSNLPRCACARS